MSDGLTPDRLPAWHQDLQDGLSFPLAWPAGHQDPAAWRSQARAAFRAALIEDSHPPPPDFQVEASEQRQGYRVEKISLALGRHRRSHALLATPDGPGPFPAAVLLHDHGAFFAIGKEKLIRPLAGDPTLGLSRDWLELNYEGNAIGDDLARRGWVVFAADALGWGERTCGAYEHQQALAANLYNLGSSWAGVIACEDLAAAAFLAGLPRVDAGRIASVGHSMGGFRSWQLAALSDQVGAAVAVCCFGTTSSLMRPGGNRTRGQSAFATTHPGLSRLLDFPDMAACAAPKPLLLIHGRDDPLFGVDGVEAGCAKASRVWEAFGEGERFRSVISPGGHRFRSADQLLAWEWLEGCW